MVLSPITCNEYDNDLRNININYNLCNFNLLQNITSYFQSIGYEIGQCDNFTIVQQGVLANLICDLTGYYLQYSEEPLNDDVILLTSNICDKITEIKINLSYNENCFDDCFDCNCFWEDKN